MRKALISEVKAFVYLCLGLLLFLSIISYTPQDISFLETHYNRPPKNFVSYFGAYLGFGAIFLLGQCSILIPLLFMAKGLEQAFSSIRLPEGLVESKSSRIIFYIFFFVLVSGLGSFIFVENRYQAFKVGGLLGWSLSHFLYTYFGKIGGFLVSTTLLGLTTVSLFGLAIITKFLNFMYTVYKKIPPLKPKKTSVRIQRNPATKISNRIAETKIQLIKKKPSPSPKITVSKKEVDLNSNKKSVKTSSFIQKEPPAADTHLLPPTSLLNSPPPLSQRKITENLKENARILKETLEDFGVNSEVVNIDRGPTVTLYELNLAPGTKVQRIHSLSEDIALALKAPSVRVVAPLPGRGTVGIEVPNIQKHIVYLKEILDEPQFKNHPSFLTLGLGKDISGKPVIANLGSMPHLLIAGTTGSGKTVCINCIISSILFKAPANRVKFILIDPKMVELSLFSDIPHLLCPVISDVNKSSRALNWAVEEMESRYKILAEEGARNIEILNKKNFRLPYIVIIIDELADLMLTSKEQVESSIQRLAQLARAVGIHLVLATQRPSVDVITGVIKANFPARISFKVASKVDSRTVLDFSGADKLLGKGYMLFLRPDLGRPIRCQGSFVSDEEIANIVSFLKEQGGASYDETLMNSLETHKVKRGQKDPLFEEAVDVVLEAGQASVSILQRRLHLSYPRAARIIDMMEDEGIIGPFEGSRPRKILIDKLSWKSREQKNDRQ